MRVRKVVIPAAGLGTRFLPATKSQPKEMLPLVDKPAIQYVVEEAIRCGLDDILMVTSHSKRSIEDHFDRSGELEDSLERAGKYDVLEEIREISRLPDIHYVRQREPKGLGHAVMVAEKHIGREPFVVMLGDDLPDPESNLLAEMINEFEKYGRSVIAVTEVEKDQISNYGCIESEARRDCLARILNIVEKPDPEDAPSNLAVIGRYVFTPEIFDALEDTPPDEHGEIQLTDAIRNLAGFQTTYAYVYDGVRYDISDKIDYMKAIVNLAVARADVGPQFREFLGAFCKQHGIT